MSPIAKLIWPLLISQQDYAASSRIAGTFIGFFNRFSIFNLILYFFHSVLRRQAILRGFNRRSHVKIFSPYRIVSAKLHYTDTGYGHVVQHHQRTAHSNSTTCCTTNSPPTDKNLPHPNIWTCRDVGLCHCDVANLLYNKL